MGYRKIVTITAECVFETDGAFLLNNGDVEDWFPKSVTEEHHDGTFTVPEVMAEDKGFV